MNSTKIPVAALDLTNVERRAGAVVQFVLAHFLLLPIGAAVALVWANTSAESYFRFAHPLTFVVNKVGMTFFVGLVVQEIVEEMVPGGALHAWRQRILPVLAALGGAAGSIFAYFAYLKSQAEYALLPGWPAAAAVDVAFAYFIAKSLFRRQSAIAFLLMIAVTSDALAIATIVVVYTRPEAYVALTVLMGAAIGTAIVLRHARMLTVWPYLAISGSLAWAACYWGGVDPAFALVPIVPFMPHAPRQLDPFADAPGGVHNSARHYEYVWKKPVQVILLFFGLVNGGVLLQMEMPGSVALVFAALVGRPIGILTMVAIGVFAGLRLPERLHWRELVVASCAASTGFAVALLFAAVLFPPSPVLGELKLGALLTILGGGLAAAIARLLHVGRFERPTAA